MRFLNYLFKQLLVIYWGPALATVVGLYGMAYHNLIVSIMGVYIVGFADGLTRDYFQKWADK